jgi:hypothetical protein
VEKAARKLFKMSVSIFGETGNFRPRTLWGVRCLEGALYTISLRLFHKKNLGAVSDEHRERFHQNILTIKGGTEASGVQYAG